MKTNLANRGGGWIKRNDYNIQDGFGGLVIYE